MPLDDAFVESHKFRRAVWKQLVAGETDPERIAKKEHIIQRAADQAIQDLEEHGLVEDTGDGFELTEKGEEYEKDRKSQALGS